MFRLRGTPFHARTSALCQGQNWRRWAGYVVAGSYELSHEREYHAIRSAVALLDVSPLFKYTIRGRDSVRLLNRVVTRDVERCVEGQVMYTPWCDEDGKVLDDGTLSRLGPDSFRLTAAEPNLYWLRRNARGMQVAIEDVSASLAVVALQGPASRDVLSELSDSVQGLPFFRLVETRLAGLPVTISRTGYTGDLGYEIWIAADRAESLWDLLIDSGRPFGITPAGMLALDVARVEAGLILIDVDYVPARKAVIDSRKSSPFELGLGWTVKLDKEYFVGAQALRSEKKRGAKWELRGLEIDWDSLDELYGSRGLPPQLPAIAWRTSVPVYALGGQVGYATSGCWSPTLKKYITLAHLQVPHSRPGNELLVEVTVEHQRMRARARVVQPPFFNPRRKRA